MSLCHAEYQVGASGRYSLISPIGISVLQSFGLIVLRLCAQAFHLRTCRTIVIAVALHQIDYAPDTKPGSKCYNKGLQNVYCAIEKCHKYILSAASAAVRQADKRRSAYAAAQKNRPLVKAAVPALRKFCGAAVFSCRGCGSCRCVLRRKVGARIM